MLKDMSIYNSKVEIIKFKYLTFQTLFMQKKQLYYSMFSKGKKFGPLLNDLKLVSSFFVTDLLRFQLFGQQA